MVDFAETAYGQATQLETSNGERNKLATTDRAFHDWYRFATFAVRQKSGGINTRHDGFGGRC